MRDPTCRSGPTGRARTATPVPAVQSENWKSCAVVTATPAFWSSPWYVKDVPSGVWAAAGRAAAASAAPANSERNAVMVLMASLLFGLSVRPPGYPSARRDTPAAAACTGNGVFATIGTLPIGDPGRPAIVSRHLTIRNSGVPWGTPTRGIVMSDIGDSASAERAEGGAQPEDGAGSRGADLLLLVYQELRRLARSRMSNLADGQTLQPTALVHEAYLRL